MKRVYRTVSGKVQIYTQRVRAKGLTLLSGVYETLPVSFYNIGSMAAWKIDLKREALYLRLHDRLAELAVRIPVLFVSESQMGIITPPHLKRGLNKRGVESLLREAIVQERQQSEQAEHLPEAPLPLQRAWDSIQQHMEETSSEDSHSKNPYWVQFAPVGLYFGCSTEMSLLITQLLLVKESEQMNDALAHTVAGLTTPVIFICPERVLEWGARLGIDADFVFDFVLYHELGHAYMDTNNNLTEALYRVPWGRVIEESLANWIAFSQFSKAEARYVQKLISTQPAEYQGYLTVNHTLSDADWQQQESESKDRTRENDMVLNPCLTCDYRSQLIHTWGSYSSLDEINLRLRQWRRFKQVWNAITHAPATNEERYWQVLAAQILLEV